jgi:hypothetical protein
MWLAGKNKLGYGIVGVGRTSRLAHRVAYELARGKITGGRLLRHTCDNPACCEPTHLVPGSDADNVADCIARGRRAAQAGMANANRKLSIEQVREIRNRYSTGNVTIVALGAEYGISKSQIHNIVSGTQWREWNQMPGVTDG